MGMLKKVVVIILVGILLFGCASLRAGINKVTALTQLKLTPTTKTTSSAKESIGGSIITQQPTPKVIFDKAIFMEAFSPSDACELPCILGVVPNQTTENEMAAILASYGLQAEVNEYAGSMFYNVDIDISEKTSLSMTFTTDHRIVRDIEIIVNNSYDRTRNQELWSVLSPKEFIEIYGNPTDIRFAYDPGGYQASLGMTMVYVKQSFIVEYFSYGSFTTKDNWTEACPALDELDGIRIWIDENKDSEVVSQVAVSELTGLTVDEFIASAFNDSGDICFSWDESAFYR